MSHHSRLQSDGKNGQIRILNICNFVHLMMGLCSVVLCVGQFSQQSYLQIENPYFDLRALNILHAITGLCGFFMVLKSYGSIALESLYSISIAIGAITIAFYADLLITSNNQFKMTHPNQTDRSFYHQSDFIIISIIIAIAVIEIINGVISKSVLNGLSNSPAFFVVGKAVKGMSRITYMAVGKVLLGILLIALGSYLEYSKKQIYVYLRTAQQNLTGVVFFLSGILDGVVAVNRQGRLVKAKVALTMSIVATVLCLKSVDYFTLDSQLPEDTAAFKDIKSVASSSSIDSYQQRLILRGLELFILTICFALGLFSVAHHSQWMEKVRHSDILSQAKEKLKYFDVHIRRQRCCLGAVQIVAGLALVALFVISFLPWEVAKGFNGSRVLWVGLLLLAAGLVTSSETATFLMSVYVMSLVASLISLEYMAYAALEILYFNKSANSAKSAAAVLNWVKCGVLGAAFVFSMTSAIHFGKILGKYRRTFKTAYNMHKILSFFGILHLLYGILAMVGSILARYVKILHRDFPMPEFADTTNGFLMMAAGILQFRARCNSRFIESAAIMNIICASVDLFIIAPCCSDLYTLLYHRTILDLNDEAAVQAFNISVGLTAGIFAMATLNYAISCISAMFHCHTIYHSFAPRGSGRATSYAYTLPLSGRYPGDLPPAAEENGYVKRYLTNRSGQRSSTYHRFNDSLRRLENSLSDSRISSSTQTNVRHMFNHGFPNGSLHRY